MKHHKKATHPSEHACPACGRTDQWEDHVAIRHFATLWPGESTSRHPEIVVSCGCGAGELSVFVDPSGVGKKESTL